MIGVLTLVEILKINLKQTKTSTYPLLLDRFK